MNRVPGVSTPQPALHGSQLAHRLMLCLLLLLQAARNPGKSSKAARERLAVLMVAGGFNLPFQLGHCAVQPPAVSCSTTPIPAVLPFKTSHCEIWCCNAYMFHFCVLAGKVKKPSNSSAADDAEEDSQHEASGAAGGGSRSRRAAEEDADDDESDREEVDWESNPADAILSSGAGSYLVARKGLMLTEYGKVDMRKAKERLLHSE
jgi:hypothetical protein